MRKRRGAKIGRLLRMKDSGKWDGKSSVFRSSSERKVMGAVEKYLENAPKSKWRLKPWRV